MTDTTRLDPESEAVRAIRTTLRAEGFSCPSCVAKIEKQVATLAGVDAVKVHFASGRIEVDHDPQRVTSDELISSVGKAGYKARAAAF